jgi:HSP20 family protein
MFKKKQQLMRGFFDDPFFREPFGRFGQMERWFGDFSPNRFSPSVEVSDEGKALKVTAELPGVFRTERYYGYFQRAVPLLEDVDRSHRFREGAKYDSLFESRRTTP